MSNLSANTIKRATVAMQGNQATGLPEIVELVQALSEKALEISVQELAVVVEKDAAVLARILSIANAFGYNPSGVPVNTVSGAIQVIGFERIRTLAISLMLVEQSSRTQTVDERREAAMFALFSGCLAKSMADRVLGVDAEEAFVCASLRHFGRIVMSTFMTDEYRQAQMLQGGLGEDESFKTIFGLTPLELSYELLKAEHLPAEILAALQRFRPEKIKSVENPAVRCHALADFASQMCILIFDTNLSQEEFERKAQGMSKHYTKVFPGILNEFDAVLGTTRNQLESFYEGVGASIMPRECMASLQARIAKIDPMKPLRRGRPASSMQAAGTKRAGDAAEADQAGANETAEEAPAPAAVEPGIEAWEDMARGDDVPESSLYQLMLTFLAKALKADECVLFLRGAAEDSPLRVAQGVGRVWSTWIQRAMVQPSERTALGLCLTRRENILIHDARELKLEQHLPPWLREEKSLGAFILIPILDRRRRQGLVVVGWPKPRRIEINAECAELLRRLNRALPKA